MRPRQQQAEDEQHTVGAAMPAPRPAEEVSHHRNNNSSSCVRAMAVAVAGHDSRWRWLRLRRGCDEVTTRTTQRQAAQRNEKEEGQIQREKHRNVDRASRRRCCSESHSPLGVLKGVSSAAQGAGKSPFRVPQSGKISAPQPGAPKSDFAISRKSRSALVEVPLTLESRRGTCAV